MIGKKVKVTFANNWPIRSATYTYEGFDDKGHWVRRKDGVQRYLNRHDVVDIQPVEEDIDEQPY